MLSSITAFADRLGLEPRSLILLGLFVGSLLVFIGLVRVARERSIARVRERMRAAVAAGNDMPAALSLFVPPEADHGAIARAFMPTGGRERTKVRRDLAHAGFSGPRAVLWFYVFRVSVGLVLPGLLVVAVLYRDVLPLPAFFAESLGQLAGNQLLLMFAVMILFGFYAPSNWLAGRAKDRRQRIEMAFPNALDLMQVSIETGLGFDAALARVAAELHHAAPEIAQEFTAAQQEILAGRDRDGAFQAMAERLGIDEAYSFVNVVLQSVRFGTSMSQSLLVYSAEMRQRREIRAQEKANKLPVLMSATMALFMMPSLLIVTIGPVVLRYMETFAE